ncbi:MAG: DNA cytosine methyltransferase, partial [Candidatus Binatia bacterium]
MTAYIHPKILTREIRHFHLFCGLGGGAKGFNKANPRVGNLQGKFRCIGGIDVNAAAIRDVERRRGSRGTVLDLFARDQFK